MGEDDKKQKEIGTPPGEELANGPVEKRSCTDILCCLIFVAFWVGFFGITIWALKTGQPQKIGRGYDADGNLCGYDEGFEEYKYLYFAVPVSDHYGYTVCVKTCPVKNEDDTQPTTIDCHTVDDFFPTCDVRPTEDIVPLALDPSDYVEGDMYFYPTKAFLQRFCLPSSDSAADILKSMEGVTDSVMSGDTLEQWISDLRTTWPVIAGMAGAAIILGFIYMFFMRYCSGVMTWGSILGMIIVFGVLGILYYTGADNYAEVLEAYQTGSTTSTSENSETSQRILAYVCWGAAGAIFLMTCCLYSRIKLAVAIMKAAADYVKSTPSCMLVPPLMLIALILFYAYWGITAIYLFSSGEAVRVAGSPFGGFEYDTTQKRLIIYSVFALLWGNAFIIASAQFVIASSVCMWYFAQPESPHGTVKRGFKRLLRYHIGSIAFGSFILAVVQFIRICLAYVEQQMKKQGAANNRVAKYVLKCCQCYMACFERFIKFLNKNAYIQIALRGKSFCPAAKDAFFLILRNPLRFGVTNSIGAIFILFGKFMIAASSTLIGYCIIKYTDEYKTSVYSPIIPSIAIFITSWGIGAVFLTVYGLAADTILACFVVDEELQKKKNAGPLHCPESLRDFISKNKKD